MGRQWFWLLLPKQKWLGCRAETRQNFNGDSSPFVIEDLFGKKMDTRPYQKLQGKALLRRVLEAEMDVCP